MYTTYFGFQEEPFSLTPTSRLFYTNPVYEEACTQLLDGIYKRKGFMVLTGEVGTGKTTLLRRLLNKLEEDPTVSVVFCYYSTLTSEEFLSFVCEGLGLAGKDEEHAQELQAFTKFLVARAQEGGTTALLIDEAQDLEEEVLENLLLANSQPASEKLLQVVLVGQQPELEEKLSQPRLSQLKQKIALRCQLEHLKTEEVSTFIHHRLRLVGYERQDLFNPVAIQRIASYSQGVPRLINLICDNALRTTYETCQKTVSAEVIHEVVHNLRLKEKSEVARPETREVETSLRRREDTPELAGEPPQYVPKRPVWGGEETLTPASPPLRTGFIGRIPRLLVWSGGAGAFLALVGLLVLTSSQNAMRGKAVLENLTRRYPDVRPMVWGLATATPAIALLIPESEWNTLAKGDQVSLTLYLEGLIPAVRADPDQYLEEFRAAPIYETFRTKVASLCGDCWVIGVGHLTADTKSILFDKVIVQGDSLWEKDFPDERGVKASEFRARR
jgi:general secretion pathway protein A